GRHHSQARADDADARRVSRPSGDRRSVRRRGRLRARASARQGEPGATRRRRALHRAPAAVRCGSLSLARRNAPAGRARADRARGRRRSDGRAASRAADRRSAVPSRVGPDAGRSRARTQLPRGTAVIQSTIPHLLDGRDLTRDDARAAMNTIMAGEATPAQIAGFLVALRAKGETADEIAGCAEAMREHVLRVNPTRSDLVDVVGTGGDGANTYNISTAAALVTAAAGAAVAKHGNRAASSQTGAADVLEALGFRLEAPPERIERSIDELGFGFLFAQAHHPAMRHAAPVRRELATRTVF